METFNNADGAQSSVQSFGSDAARSASHLANTATGEIRNLIADVEDLVARIANLKDGDVARIRGKVMRAVEATKESMSDSADTLRRQAQRAAAGADDYVHDNPWQAVGIAAFVGAVVGILAARRS